jgi:hypothetical protein
MFGVFLIEAHIKKKSIAWENVEKKIQFIKK